MAIQNINLHYRCEECAEANSWGTGCTYGLLFPVLLKMSGAENCPNFRHKTREQLEEQIRQRQMEKELFENAKRRI